MPFGKRCTQRRSPPHACGEYSERISSSPIPCGSPPRVWGILELASEGGWRDGFTPTRVGNTASRSARACLRPVHPHACGEYLNSPSRCRNAIGSPPRVWGIHLFREQHRPLARFTPTRVGNTGGPDAGSGGRAVHPHACGEYPSLRRTATFTVSCSFSCVTLPGSRIGAEQPLPSHMPYRRYYRSWPDSLSNPRRRLTSGSLIQGR